MNDIQKSMRSVTKYSRQYENADKRQSTGWNNVLDSMSVASGKSKYQSILNYINDIQIHNTEHCTEQKWPKDNDEECVEKIIW